MSRTPIHIDKPWVKKSAFSQGVVVEGRLLYSAGITARDRDGNLVGAGDIRKQIETCFENLGHVLHAAGADFKDVVKYTMYTTDIEAFHENTDVYRAHFIDHPASTLVEVRKLALPEMTVEIEAVARLP